MQVQRLELLGFPLCSDGPLGAVHFRCSYTSLQGVVAPTFKWCHRLGCLSLDFTAINVGCTFFSCHVFLLFSAVCRFWVGLACVRWFHLFCTLNTWYLLNIYQNVTVLWLNRGTISSALDYEDLFPSGVKFFGLIHEAGGSKACEKGAGQRLLA